MLACTVQSKSGRVPPLVAVVRGDALAVVLADGLGLVVGFQHVLQRVMKKGEGSEKGMSGSTNEAQRSLHTY